MIIHEYEKIDLAIPPEFRRYFSEKWGEVRATNYCGALKIGDKTITILPKIDKNNDDANLRYLTYMLSYVYDLKVDESVASTGYWITCLRIPKRHGQMNSKTIISLSTKSIAGISPKYLVS